MPDAAQAVDAVWAMSDIRTGLGRGRAFVKFALIERRLGDYFGALVGNIVYVKYAWLLL